MKNLNMFRDLEDSNGQNLAKVINAQNAEWLKSNEFFSDFENTDNSVIDKNRVFQSFVSCKLAAILYKSGCPDLKDFYLYLYKSILLWQNTNILNDDEIKKQIRAFSHLDLPDSCNDYQIFFNFIASRNQTWVVSAVEELFNYFCGTNLIWGKSQKVKVLLVMEGKGQTQILEVYKRKTNCNRTSHNNFSRDILQNAFLQYDTDFQKALDNAIKCVAGKTNHKIYEYDYKWLIKNPHKIIEGNSMGAAFAFCLFYPLKRSILNRNQKETSLTWAVTGAIDEEGKLNSVGGYEEKLYAIANNTDLIIPKCDTEKVEHLDNQHINYADSLEELTKFLSGSSLSFRRAYTRLKKTRRLAIGLSVVAVVLALTTSIFAINYWKANNELKDANSQLAQNKHELEIANQQLEIANQQLEDKKNYAEKQEGIAKDETKKALVAESDLQKLNKIINQQKSEIEAKNINLASTNDDLKVTNDKLAVSNKDLEIQTNKAKNEEEKAKVYKQLADAQKYYLKGERAYLKENYTMASLYYSTALNFFDVPEIRSSWINTASKNRLKHLWSNNDIKFSENELSLQWDGKFERKMISTASNDKYFTIAHKNLIEIFKLDGTFVRSVKFDGFIEQSKLSSKNELFAVVAKENEQDAENPLNTKFLTLNIEDENSLKLQEINGCKPVSIALNKKEDKLAFGCIKDKKTVKTDLKGSVLNSFKIKNDDFKIAEQVFFDSENNIYAVDTLLSESGLTYKNDKEFISAEEPMYYVGLSQENHLSFMSLLGGLKLFDKSGNELYKSDNETWDYSNANFSKSISPNGRYVVLANTNYELRVFDTKDKSKILFYDNFSDPISAVHFITDSHFVVISNIGKVSCWELEMPNSIKLKPDNPDNPPTILSVNPESNIVALNDNNKIKLVYIGTNGEVLRELKLDATKMISTNAECNKCETRIEYLPPGTSQISWSKNGVYLGKTNNFIVLSSIKNGDVVFKTKSDGVLAADLISPNGELFAISEQIENKGVFKIWNIATNKEIFNYSRPDKAVTSDGTEHFPTVYKVAFSNDNKFVALVYRDGLIEVRNIENKQLVYSSKAVQNQGTMIVSELSFSFDNRYLAFAAPLQVNILDLENPASFGDINDFALDVKFMPSENILVWTHPYRKQINFYDYKTGKNLIIKTDALPFSLGFSFKDLLVSDTNGNIAFWNLNQIKESIKEETQILPGETGLEIFPEKDYEKIPFSNEEFSKMLNKYKIDKESILSEEKVKAISSDSTYQRPATKHPIRADNQCIYEIPMKAELNARLPITYARHAPLCSIYSALALVKMDGQFPKNQEDWENGITVKSDEEFYGFVYITNVASNNPKHVADPNFIAQNVKLTIETDESVGNKHYIKISFRGDNTNVITSQLPVFTEDNEYLEIIKDSGQLLNNKSSVILNDKILINGKSPIIIGNIPPGFETDKWFKFRIKVKKK